MREFKIVNIVFRLMMNMLVVLKWTNRVLKQRFATIHIYNRDTSINTFITRTQRGLTTSRRTTRQLPVNKNSEAQLKGIFSLSSIWKLNMSIQEETCKERK